MQKLYCYVDETGQDTKGKMFFDYHLGIGSAFFDLMLLATAKAINEKAKDFYQATVVVDGLKKSEKARFAVGLRKLKIRVKKVRGARDESDEFVRLADIIAGFARKSIEGNVKMSELFRKASKVGIIKEV